MMSATEEYCEMNLRNVDKGMCVCVMHLPQRLSLSFIPYQRIKQNTQECMLTVYLSFPICLSLSGIHRYVFVCQWNVTQYMLSSHIHIILINLLEGNCNYT